MSAEQKQNKPDFTQGVAASSVADGAMVVGRVGKADVLLTRQGGEWFAVGAHCTHYRGPLAKGLIVGDTIRCPLHHACFNLRTGEAVQAPAFDPIACWQVEHEGDQVFVRNKFVAPAPAASAVSPAAPESIVIVGGGAAGFAAAEMLRREGYEGPVTMISADQDPPVDRPNLVEGLPVWRGQGRLDSAVAENALRGTTHRSAVGPPGDSNRHRCPYSLDR